MKAISFLAVSMAIFAIAVGFSHNKNGSVVSSEQAINGAFTDGAYLGSLAAQRGEIAHIASGRWSPDEDRKSFSDGYFEAYDQALSRIMSRKTADQNSQGAYRDGIYLGKLDAEQGRSEHVASGRWAQEADKESFAAGYREAYSDAISAQMEKRKGTAQALLVR